MIQPDDDLRERFQELRETDRKNVPLFVQPTARGRESHPGPENVSAVGALWKHGLTFGVPATAMVIVTFLLVTRPSSRPLGSPNHSLTQSLPVLLHASTRAPLSDFQFGPAQPEFQTDPLLPLYLTIDPI